MENIGLTRDGFGVRGPTTPLAPMNNTNAMAAHDYQHGKPLADPNRKKGNKIKPNHPDNRGPVPTPQFPAAHQARDPSGQQHATWYSESPYNQPAEPTYTTPSAAPSSRDAGDPRGFQQALSPSEALDELPIKPGVGTLTGRTFEDLVEREISKPGAGGSVVSQRPAPGPAKSKGPAAPKPFLKRGARNARTVIPPANKAKASTPKGEKEPAPAGKKPADAASKPPARGTIPKLKLEPASKGAAHADSDSVDVRPSKGAANRPSSAPAGKPLPPGHEDQPLPAPRASYPDADLYAAEAYQPGAEEPYDDEEVASGYEDGAGEEYLDEEEDGGTEEGYVARFLALQHKLSEVGGGSNTARNRYGWESFDTDGQRDSYQPGELQESYGFDDEELPEEHPEEAGMSMEASSAWVQVGTTISSALHRQPAGKQSPLEDEYDAMLEGGALAEEEAGEAGVGPGTPPERKEDSTGASAAQMGLRTLEWTARQVQEARELEEFEALERELSAGDRPPSPSKAARGGRQQAPASIQIEGGDSSPPREPSAGLEPSTGVASILAGLGARQSSAASRGPAPVSYRAAAHGPEAPAAAALSRSSPPGPAHRGPAERDAFPGSQIPSWSQVRRSEEFDDGSTWSSPSPQRRSDQSRASAEARPPPPAHGPARAEEPAGAPPLPGAPPPSQLVQSLFFGQAAAAGPAAGGATRAGEAAAAGGDAEGAGEVMSAAEGARVAELEAEIAQFRTERARVDQLRADLEGQRQAQQRDQEAHERRKAEELAAFEEERAEELRKLKRDKRVLEKQAKAVLKLPQKQQRGQVEALEAALQRANDTLMQREARHKLTTERLRQQNREAQDRINELSEQVRRLEARQLDDWDAAKAAAAANGNAKAAPKEPPAAPEASAAPPPDLEHAPRPAEWKEEGRGSASPPFRTARDAAVSARDRDRQASAAPAASHPTRNRKLFASLDKSDPSRGGMLLREEGSRAGGPSRAGGARPEDGNGGFKAAPGHAAASSGPSGAAESASYRRSHEESDTSGRGGGGPAYGGAPPAGSGPAAGSYSEAADMDGPGRDSGGFGAGRASGGGGGADRLGRSGTDTVQHLSEAGMLELRGEAGMLDLSAFEPVAFNPRASAAGRASWQAEEAAGGEAGAGSPARGPQGLGPAAAAGQAAAAEADAGRGAAAAASGAPTAGRAENTVWAPRPGLHDLPALNQDSAPLQETHYADGKVEKVYASGRRSVLFANGTRKDHLPAQGPHGGISVVFFANGDIKRSNPHGRVDYYYAEVDTWHSSHPDGVEVYFFANGQTEAHNADHSKDILFPDGSLRHIRSDGVTVEEYSPSHKHTRPAR